MVTKSNTPVPPNGQVPLKTMPKIAPATVVSGVGVKQGLKNADPSNKDKTGDDKFTLPEKVTPAQIRDQSFKYGGSRSSGNKSIAENMQRRVTEP